MIRSELKALIRRYAREPMQCSAGHVFGRAWGPLLCDPGSLSWTDRIKASAYYCPEGGRRPIAEAARRVPYSIVQDAFSVRDRMLSDTTETLNDITSGITKSKAV